MQEKKSAFVYKARQHLGNNLIRGVKQSKVGPERGEGAGRDAQVCSKGCTLNLSSWPLALEDPASHHNPFLLATSCYERSNSCSSQADLSS